MPAKQAEASRELALNAPIARELLAGETHLYEITLVAGSYLRLLISPSDIDVESRLLAPGGSDDIGVSYYPTEKGTRFVSLIADASGSYRLEVRLAEAAKPGRYEVKIEERRPGSERDRIRIAAEKAEGEARILVNRSNGVERVRQGLSKFEEALTLWRQIGERKGEMRILTNAGNRYREIGEPQTALEYGNRAIQIARTLGDRYQEATLNVSLGILYKSLGENQKALDSFTRARQLFKDLSARYGEATAVYNIGRTLAVLGELQDGLRHLEEALPVFSTLGDPFGETNSLNAIGTIHRSLGDNQKGIEFHKRALAVARKSSRADMEAYSLGNLGNVYLELGDRQKALEFYEQAVTLSRPLGDVMGEGDALRMIGEIAYSQGDNQRAADSLNRSLNLFRSIWGRDREARTLQSLAQVNCSLGNFAEAKKQIKMALEIQEDLRGKVISQQFRETMFTSAQSGFALYIDLLMQSHHENPSAGHDAAALQANERARSRSLLDLLAESHADIREGVPHTLLDRERSLQQQINAKAATRTRLLSNNRIQAQAASFNKEIGELTSRYRELEVQIRQSSPRYAALTRPQPLTATEIQQQLDDNTVLLEFALGAKHSWLWAVTRSSISSYRLPSSSLIEPLARKLYERLTARQPKAGETEDQYHTRLAEADVSFQGESATLSQMLFGQIAGKLQHDWKGKRLAVVAPGALEYIPFAALPVVGERSSVADAQKANGDRPSINQYRPMILDHEIVNLPSASALAAIRNETAGRKPAEKTLAILADPVFEPTDSRVHRARSESSSGNLIVNVGAESQASSSGLPSPASSTRAADLKQSASSFSSIHERGGFSRLPFSREEAEAIASLAPKDSFMKATDFQANRSTAMNAELSHYRIIHFATHGLLNSEHPELSGLVLSLVDEDGKPQDGFLRTREIYNLRLPADLIVLSGCQTALGKQIKGEALVGLTRGFIYAGAQRIVASLWQVDDLATAQLMKSFYSGMLKDKLRPAAAIRAAQLELLKQKRWSSPYFWAAFTIQGEWK